MEPSRLSAIRRGHPQRPRYGLSGEGTHRGPGTDRHLYRMDPSGLSAVRRGLQRPRYGQALVQNGALWAVAVRRGHPQRPWYRLTLVQNGAVQAVGRQARAPTETQYGQTLVQNGALRAVSHRASATETPVRTDTCTEWSPPGCQLSGEGTHRDPGMGCQPSGEGTHRDPGTDRHLYRMETLGCQPSGEGTYRDPSTDRHLYRMEPSGLSAVRRGLQRPRYGQTLVQNGALWAVSCQVREPTETLVWDCQPSGEGTHRDPGTDRHLYRMELSAVRRGHPQRPLYGLSALR
ncbi:hypothetical protein NDU88_006670 [Pleurodeles waltl]|uniref:Uncharacterized protein n=1 Tax=Pleurodeles waltl TaxID=8319 RepID=A0AAV7L897_PLEWA|nr:hypothetical protein NDU88_006670 [Pleurodeles waltl]